MEETKQEFVRITYYNMDYCYYCSSVALSSIPGAVKYVGESGPGAGW